MTLPIVDNVKAATSPEALLASLHWRYAVKKFDPSRKIPDATWKALEEALVLAPSSYGFQPWKFIVVDDAGLRAKLKSASYNQSQIADAARFVVFAVKKDFGPQDVERYLERIVEVRKVSRESLEQYKQMMLGSVSQPVAQVDAWNAHQVYIALGVFLTSAAMLGIDACPMEGIESPKYNEILGLTKQGYSALCVATAGYRAEGDIYGKLPKVRFALPEVIEHL